MARGGDVTVAHGMRQNGNRADLDHKVELHPEIAIVVLEGGTSRDFIFSTD